jgi:nitrate reductase molybdenum cofactor assembly chaperone NarJ/NarW
VSHALPIAPAAARLLADVLSYPDAGLPRRMRAGAAALPGDGSGLLSRLADRLDALGPSGAEELYTATFDLRPAVSPYAGHHLCGEGPRRNALLAWLAGLRAEVGLGPAREVPDHLAELLRWLSVAGDHAEAPEVALLAVAPAARSALAELSLENPYRDALEALLAALATPAAKSARGEEVAP